MCCTANPFLSARPMVHATLSFAENCGNGSIRLSHPPSSLDVSFPSRNPNSWALIHLTPMSACPQVPALEETLTAHTADVLHGVAKHDMAEALEHIVSGISEVKDELQQAFLARDKEHTGAIGGPDFKASY